MTYKFTGVVEKEGALYVALCPELDVASQGKSFNKAISNLKEAVQLYLESASPAELKKYKTPPQIIPFDIAI